MKGHELKQGKTLTFLLIGAMLFHSTSTMANEMLWDRISKREDAKITIRKSLDGRDLRSANFQGGVTFSETERGDTIATDNSGKGAILCEWAIYNELKKHADRCNATPEVKNFLNTSLKKMKEFIVANSIILFATINSFIFFKEVFRKFLTSGVALQRSACFLSSL